MQTKEISFEMAAEILERMNIADTLSRGSLMIHTGTHPEHEDCSLVLGDRAFLISAVRIFTF